MALYFFALGACLLLILSVYVLLARARRNKDARPVRALQLLKIGLCLSAVSYLSRLADAPHGGQVSPLGVASCLLGTFFLWLGFWEHRRLRLGQGDVPRRAPDEEERDAGALPAPPEAAGLEPMTARARRVVLRAQWEALRRRDPCVDTHHLLLGLLDDPGSAGVRVLERLDARPEQVHLELLERMLNAPASVPAGPSAFAEGARQVFVLAAQEAHRFGKGCVGTEHLLLGLVLMGKGRAASVLYAAGVTADGVRALIVEDKKAA
jgi:hypothetical protein